MLPQRRPREVGAHNDAIWRGLAMGISFPSLQRTPSHAPPGAWCAAAPRAVLLVDDHELIRLGVRTRFAKLHGVEIRWVDADSLHAAIALYREDTFDAVLLDLNLVDCKGLQALRRF